MEDSSDLKLHISRLLVEVDPMRIYFNDAQNRDEYDPEAEELARLLSSCKSRDACLDAVYNVFQRYFGDLIASRAEGLESVANRLWAFRNGLWDPSRSDSA